MNKLKFVWLLALVGTILSLVIASSTVVLADWVPDDGHKMHYPQFPDPFGWDIDFHDMELADDWGCSETDSVEDIHFWISWLGDMVPVDDIPWIRVSIWSNYAGPPSRPNVLLWSRTFYSGQFVVAGPFEGDQGFYWPSWPDWVRPDHYLYFQINIKDISDPFFQEEGTIYWLSIAMPFYYYPEGLGWKTSLDHFMDAAVYGWPPDWWMLVDPITGEQLDLAFVITGGPLEPPDTLMYFKACYPDYAPAGMPDFDQKQDSWDYPTGSGNWTYCGPVAVANCFWWVDSRFEAFLGPGGGIPGDGADSFPLVRDYNEPLPVDPTQPGPNTDDHGFENVDDLQTPPPPPAPPPLPPFPTPPVTGAELVERLAWAMDTDGMRTGSPHQGTYQYDMQMGIDEWIYEQELDTLLYEHTEEMPTFAWIDTQIHKSQDVILLLGFWWFDGDIWWRHGGHYVTVAGVNSKQSMLAFSDPFLDLAGAGFLGCVHNSIYKPHNHGLYGPQTHNDAGNASHDWHLIIPDSPSPGGVIWIPEYPFTYADLIYYFMHKNYRYPDDEMYFQEWDGMAYIHTEVECAVVVSPWPDWHDAPNPYPEAHHSDWTEEWLGASVSADMAPRLVNLDTYDDGVTFFDYNQGDPGSLKVIISVRDRFSCEAHGGRYDPYHLLYLHGWIDWNGDGHWDDGNENIFCALAFDPSTWSSNSHTYTHIFDVPPGAELGNTWARFRLDYNQSLNNPAGQAFCGEVEDYYDEVVVSVPGQRGDLTLPQTFELAQNYPNPFNLRTAIRYQIPQDCRVTLEIHNLLGQKVRTLVNAAQKANYYAAYWDGKNADGKGVSSGIYFYTLRAGNFTQTRRMVILK